MAMTEKQKEWRRAQRKAGKMTALHIDMRLDDLEQWRAYAQYKGKPLATLVRGLMSDAMAADGWTWDKQGQGDEIPQ